MSMSMAPRREGEESKLTGIGTQDEEEIWEVFGTHAQVRLRVHPPLFAQQGSIPTFDRPAFDP